jgi:ATP-binding cassette subfamily F protein uup
MINNISLSFGWRLLLESATFRIEISEKIGLFGRNGSGKFTLMKCLSGFLIPDSGDIIIDNNIQIGLLPQDIRDDLPCTAHDTVAAGARNNLELLTEYHNLTMRIVHSCNECLLDKLEYIQYLLEAADFWNYDLQVEKNLNRTGLEGN